MHDTLRRYRAIRDALTHASPTPPTGNVARHVDTLAARISGIVGGTSTPRPHIATQVPDGAQPERRVTRLTRWLDNERIVEEVDFVPYAALFLTHGAFETLVVVMDGRVVGRGGLALMIHVVSKGRALPLAWRVRHSPTGQGPEALHSAMVEWRRAVIPEGATVVCRGDGACDGPALQDTLHEAGWSSVCRTAMRTTATGDGETFRRDTVGACLKPGRLIA
jgi:hypothetical protein